MALREKNPGSRFKTWFFISLLAIVCIGGAELLVCRVMDPVLYEQITSPVKETFAVVEINLHKTKKKLLETKDSLVGRFTEAEESEDLEDQLAGNPEIPSDATQMADRTLAKFETVGTSEVLIGGNLPIVYYNQTDPDWTGQAYGSDTIGGYGCGPTVMSMVVSTVRKQTIDPVKMAKWAKDNGHWAAKQGSYLSIVEGASQAFGLRAEPIPELTADRLRNELASGKLVVALMTKGHFTNGGHFILLRGATLEGKILVADPSSRERSLMAWDAQLVIDELSASRSHGAPVWAITQQFSPAYAE